MLKEIYIDKYIEVIDAALTRCGHQRKDITFLLTNQIRLSMMDEVMDRLGVSRQRTIRSMDFAGHIGPGDVLLNLGRAMYSELVGPGDLAVLATSAIGFSWAASVVKFN